MGYLYLLCVAIMFSFGGTCVKLIKPYFSPEYITLFRFVVGVGFLFILKLIQKKKPNLKFIGTWIIIGAIAKWLAYWTENYALSHGPSYGNIITQPSQTVFLTIMSIFMFKEQLPFKKLICIFSCMIGVLLISWNGRSMADFFHQNLFLLILFVISGACAGTHVLAQKMTAEMDVADSNLSMFILSAVFASIPAVTVGEIYGVPNLPCILAILMFGFITGIGFYLNARAIALVPFYMVPIIQSTMVIFAIIWGHLFFGEQITLYIIAGTLFFLIGLIGINLQKA